MAYLESDTAILTEHLSKKYRRGSINASTLLESIENRWARFLKKEAPNAKIGAAPVLEKSEFWALDDINLTIKKGETVGIIGANGAGKSTLLKLLCRVTAPTAGRALIAGRVTSMLEVGTGFNLEMTGRENIYLNGAILGLSVAQVNERIRDIIEFSEVGEFIDTPLKRYSSGMFVKLAFAVSSHLDSEIVIMDEVLAVGDIAFQRKCIKKMLSMVEDGRHTILFVSHNSDQVRRLCKRGVVMDKGRVVFDGSVEDALEYYETVQSVLDTKVGDRELSDIRRPDSIEKNQRAALLGVSSATSPHGRFERADGMDFEVRFRALESFDSVYIGATLLNVEGAPLVRTRSAANGPVEAGSEYVCALRMNTEMITAGEYALALDIYAPTRSGEHEPLDCVPNAYAFKIADDKFLSEKWDARAWGSLELAALSVRSFDKLKSANG